MGNPRCLVCGGSTHKWGKTAAGRVRFRCSKCGASQSRRNDIQARYFGVFLEFVTGRLRYQDLPGGVVVLGAILKWFWRLWHKCPLVDEVHHVVFVDGIYLARNVVVLIACTKNHVLGWYVAKGEYSGAWQALFDRIAPPDVVICDGGSGIASALQAQWPTTRVQRCTFHAFSGGCRKFCV